MAIKIIEGVPGSGKTYYAVKHVSDQYFDIDKSGNITASGNAQIFTNIDSFQGSHVNLNDEMEKAGGTKLFFSNEFQKDLFEKLGPIVYVIDEAQMIFDRKFYDRSVFSWFEYHRHYGQNIYLVTQSAQKLPKDITLLVEYIIRALPRSKSITGKEFRYNHVSGKDVLKRDYLPIRQKYFDMYKSASADEVEKVKNPFITRIAVYLGLSILVVGLSLFYINKTWSSPTPSETKQLSPAQNIRRDTGFSASKPEPIPEKRIKFSYVYKLNYLSIIGGKSNYKIMFNGSVYSVRNFPYPLEIDGVNLLAIIPAEDFELMFEELPPPRTWNKRIT